MSEPITLTLDWDEQSYLKGAKAAYDLQMRQGWRRYAGWLFIAMVQFGVVGALLAGRYALLLLATLLVLYWYALRWPLRKAALKRLYARSNRTDQTLRLRADEKGLCIDDRCVGWETFRRVVASAEGYLLEMEEGVLFIPKSRFTDGETRRRFVSLLREKVPRFETI